MPIRIEKLIPIMLSLSVVGCSADKIGNQSASTDSAAPGSALGSTWADAAKMPDLFSGMWMSFAAMAEDDEKLNVPYTATAQKFVDAYKPTRDIPYAQEGCKSPGLPISMRTGPIKFTYAPGLISIYMQAVGHTRFIKMNQKQSLTSPKYYGNSVGHWEGDTLVVETEDFSPDITFQYGVGKGLPDDGSFGPGAGGPPGGPPPGAGGPPGGGPPPPDPSKGLSKAIWGPPGDGMHMVERMRLADPETLEVNLTVYDDTVWTKPFVTATRHYKRLQKATSNNGPFNGEPEEWVCTVSITSFDPKTNSYTDKDPEEMVKMLEKQGK